MPQFVGFYSQKANGFGKTDCRTRQSSSKPVQPDHSNKRWVQLANPGLPPPDRLRPSAPKSACRPPFGDSDPTILTTTEPRSRSTTATRFASAQKKPQRRCASRTSIPVSLPAGRKALEFSPSLPENTTATTIISHRVLLLAGTSNGLGSASSSY